MWVDCMLDDTGKLDINKDFSQSLDALINQDIGPYQYIVQKFIDFQYRFSYYEKFDKEARIKEVKKNVNFMCEKILPTVFSHIIDKINIKENMPEGHDQKEFIDLSVLNYQS